MCLMHGAGLSGVTAERSVVSVLCDKKEPTKIGHPGDILIRLMKDLTWEPS